MSSQRKAVWLHGIYGFKGRQQKIPPHIDSHNAQAHVGMTCKAEFSIQEIRSGKRTVLPIQAQIGFGFVGEHVDAPNGVES